MALIIQDVQVLIVVFISLPLTVFALGMRLWSRSLQRLALKFNDYMAITGAIFATIVAATCLVDVSIGVLGRHTSDLELTDPKALGKFGIFFVPGEIFWAAANTCVKLSVLSLYTVLFSGRRFKQLCYFVMGAAILYSLSVLLETFTLCQPVQYNWNKNIPGGKCADQGLALLLSGIINLVIDAVTVALPMPKLYGLQIPLTRRLAIASMFGLGALIWVISFSRILAIWRWSLKDPTWRSNLICIYTILEPMLGVVNACLPTSRPALQRLFKSRASRPDLPRTSPSQSSTAITNEGSLIDIRASGRYKQMDDDIPLTDM
ncbi:hypothetical protein F5Y16DRAFT_422985 [Xylariaceae sp. FL0255]|nr:hypothetical protein F5Y16DRAFT_422985 [Xylariaceae sp. FL0255]